MLFSNDVEVSGRGDKAKGTISPFRRVSLSMRHEKGFSLLELIVTLTVLTVLTMSVIPLVKVSVRRQREQRLRDALREMRLAIQEFHRDTMGMQCSQQSGEGNQQQQQRQQQQQGGPGVDPRSKVVITDCKIFTVDNPDHYPPDLDTLVAGVNIVARGGPPVIRETATGGPIATEVNSELSTKKKVYLRSIPVDPITGEADWEFRSCYDLPDAGSWGKENVFDVRSKAQGTALNGEKYSDW
jgi:general secretion pathway protein G